MGENKKFKLVSWSSLPNLTFERDPSYFKSIEFYMRIWINNKITIIHEIINFAWKTFTLTMEIKKKKKRSNTSNIIIHYMRSRYTYLSCSFTLKTYSVIPILWSTSMTQYFQMLQWIHHSLWRDACPSNSQEFD